MIDLHNHIIPGIDDGCADIDEALMLARIFIDRGINAICATPHIRPGMFDNSEEHIRSAGDAFAAELERSGIGLGFAFAAEYYFHERLLDALENPDQLLTLDTAGRYILVEFNYQRAPVHLKEFVFMLSLTGKRMVMAHPERYDWIAEDFDLAADLISMGVVMQGTLSSLAGEMGSRAARTIKAMLKNDLIQLVSSDCHKPGTALIMLERSFEMLRKEVSQAAADRLLNENPAIIKEGRSI